MRLLLDSVIPATIEAEAPAGVELDRWSGRDLSDEELVREAASRRFRAVVLWDRNSLEQPTLRELCAELGVGLVAVEAPDPIQAKDRLLSNFNRLRTVLAESDFVVVLSSTVRPADLPE